MTAADIARGRGQGENWRHNWRTPPEVFEPLNDVFSFALDMCATKADSLCGVHLEDVFTSPLYGNPAPGCSAWMNPPYGRKRGAFPGTGAFVHRAADLSSRHDFTAVVLVPASTDAAWWRQAFRWAACTLLLPRVAFIDPRTGERGDSPPGGSSVFVFVPGVQGGPCALWAPGEPLPPELLETRRER